MIDLAPTFAELLGATVPDWVDGRSLVPFSITPDTRPMAHGRRLREPRREF